MDHLFSTLPLQNIMVPNRIMVSPMCQYSSEDGFANDWHLVHLGSRAVGKAGIVLTEAASVSPEGRISYADLGIWKDEHIDKLKQITTFIKSQGSVPGIQLAHAGRKASKNKPWEGNIRIKPENGGWSNVVAPSAIPFKEGDPEPIALDSKGIQKVIDDFKAAARRALDAGFEIIEIHGAHGYLIHSFLSPLTNKRGGKYGGSFTNRIRLLMEIVEAVQEVWPSGLPLFVRISATDWVDSENSWDIEQSIRLAKELKNQGVDVVDVSSGGAVPYQNVPAGPGFQTKLAAQIREEADIKTTALGMITSGAQADHAIRTGQADIVALAREFLRDPYFPLHAAKEVHHDLEWPEQYQRAK